MTAPRDPDRLIRAFLLEGEEQLQDQVYDAVRADIDHRAQRVVIGPWRLPIMNKIVGFGLAAAAVLVAVLVGSQLIGSPDGGFGLGRAPSRNPGSVRAAPTPRPSRPSHPSQRTPRGGSAPPVAAAAARRSRVTITTPDWRGAGEGSSSGRPTYSSGRDRRRRIIGFMADGEYYVYGDACAWSSTTPEHPPPRSMGSWPPLQSRRRGKRPRQDITVDGYAGKKIILRDGR